MKCNRNHSLIFWITIGLACVFAAACTSSSKRTVTPAFYHWQTTLAISPTEHIYLDSLGCKKLYVKVLDVGRDALSNEIRPYSLLEIADTTGLFRFEIVPTVFITNEVFKNISEEKIEWLAGKVAEVLNPAPRSSRSTPPPTPPLKGRGVRDADSTSPLPFRGGVGGGVEREIQFDCDWTPSTRDAFFLFLKKIKKHLPKQTRLSTTIRLHQYKFPDKTGVPPVERGMLMFYNTGDIENSESANSIFQIADAEKYIIGAPKNYPLPLDLALPAFSWALIYRDGELWKIIPEMPENELIDTARFQRDQNHPGTFVIQKGTFISGHYLRPGDLLRMETISPELLREAARLAAQADLADDATVAFFHLDTSVVRRYPVQLLDSVCRMICFQ